MNQTVILEIRRILCEHPDGILKNPVIKIIVDKGLSSRVTIYKLFDECADKNGLNILQYKTIKKRNFCFPTNKAIRLNEIEEKINIVKEMVCLLKSNSKTGDFLTIFSSKEKKNTNQLKIKNTTYLIENSSDVLKKQYRKPRDYYILNSNSIFSRYFLLKELPYIVMDDFSRKYPSLSKIKSLNIFEDFSNIFTQVVEIINSDYRKNTNLALKSFFKASLKNYQKEDSDEGGVIMPTMLPFEPTMKKDWFLGKLYDVLFALNLPYEPTKNIENNESYPIINFIRAFYPKPKCPKTMNDLSSHMLQYCKM